MYVFSISFFSLLFSDKNKIKSMKLLSDELKKKNCDADLIFVCRMFTIYIDGRRRVNLMCLKKAHILRRITNVGKKTSKRVEFMQKRKTFFDSKK